MKTAISLPDDLFDAAERAAKRLKLSRSEFMARALAEYFKTYSGEQITRKLDEVYSKEEARLDPAVKTAQAKAIGKEVW